MKTSLQPSQLKSSFIPRVSLTLDEAIEHELKHGRKLDLNMDRRKLRRTISNRLSAQRSRIRKAQYITDMEKMVNDLEELISVITPQIDIYNEKRAVLILQNDSLQKLLEFRTTESNLSQMQLELKRAEVCRLRELEKTVNNHIDDLNLDPQQMHDLRLKPLNFGFYKTLVQHPHKSGFNRELYQQQRPHPNSALVQVGLKLESNTCFEQLVGQDQQTCFTFKLPIGMLTVPKNQEEAEIDQYLNFEQLNVDHASASE